MAAKAVQACFLLPDYGADPTETAIPYQAFVAAGFQVTFFTENGAMPICDSRLLQGWTGAVLGAPRAAVAAHAKMIQSQEWQHPRAWSDESVTLLDFDLVFLPGGHDKAARQLLDSAKAQALLTAYFPQCQKSRGKKACGAICHGVQLLAHSIDAASGKSVLADVQTTALPGVFENLAYQGTRLILGDYYKTYGAGTANVEDVVKQTLADPQTQWKSSASMLAPFVVQDPSWNYASGRWPGDAPLLAEKVVDMVKGLAGDV